MKTIKGLGIFTFFILLSGCFSPPEFSNIPNIDYESVVFKRGTVTAGVSTDTLILSINFRDGDGDIGLAADETDPPFHSTEYFIENNGVIDSLATTTRYADLPPILEVPKGTKGKLITNRTRKKEINGQKVYENLLPPYEGEYRCTAYRYDSIFVSEEDTAVFSKKDHYVARIMESRTNPDLYVLKDTFYYKVNPYATNIDIQFWIMQNNGSFEKFALPINYNNCLSFPDFFSARIPHLSETSSPVEGTLKYKMTSQGLIPFFGNRTIKIRVRIYDRALHSSNVVETPPFQLQ